MGLFTSPSSKDDRDTRSASCASVSICISVDLAIVGYQQERAHILPFHQCLGIEERSIFHALNADDGLYRAIGVDKRAVDR